MTHGKPQTRRSIARRAGFGAIVLAALLIAASWLVPTPMLAPLSDQAEVLGLEIYQIVDHARRLPREVALPHIARAGLRPFLVQLPLSPEVRGRVLARLDAPDFVDELVPFLLALKDMYGATEEARARNFDAHLRARFQASEEIPGIEHSMFHWQTAPDAEPGSKREGLTLEIVASLVEFYDALYLKDRKAQDHLEARLRCDDAGRETDLDAVAERARPALLELLREFARRLPEGAEMTESVEAITRDADRLETISLSVVQFIDRTVCRNYRIFASRITREAQLARWMQRELHRPAGGKLWTYLVHAQEQRRHAALVVVDGLEGHLVEALARGDASNAFVAEIHRRQVAGVHGVATTVASELAPPQQTEFLEQLATHGYHHPHYLPFFRDLYDADGAIEPWGIAISGIATTPTISVRNLPIVKTGAAVAGASGTGIPNFHFVDRDYTRNEVRQGRAYYFFGNDALQLETLTARSGMRTLFERLPERSSLSCAAQYDEWAHAGIDAFFNLAIGEASRDFGELLCFEDLEERAANEMRLHDLRAQLLESRDTLGRRTAWHDWTGRIKRQTPLRRAELLMREIAALEQRAMPELLLYYNPWPDHFAHFTGPFSDEILSPSGELARLDYWLGRLTEIYRSAGIAPRTLFGMAGDHGLAPVFRLVSPETLVLDALEAEGVPLETIKISSDEGEGPKLTNPLRPPSMRGYDVVVASTAGGNLMLDLFLDQADRWHEQPLEADLRHWQPIAWRASESDRHIDLLVELVERLGDSLDYLAIRTAPSSEARASVRILANRGTATITRVGDRVHYAFDGEDLLETSEASPFRDFGDEDRELHRQLVRHCTSETVKSDPATWCDEAQWLELTRFTPRPDSVVQLAHLYDIDRAGTVNLFPAEGIAFNSIVPGRHAGESFFEKDAFVGIWGTPMRRSAEDGRLPAAHGGSVPMAIYEHLTGTIAKQGEDGWGYPSLAQRARPGIVAVRE